MASVSIATLYAREDAPSEGLRSRGAAQIALSCFELPEPGELEGAGAILLRSPDPDTARLDAALGDSTAAVFLDTGGAWSGAAGALLVALRERRPDLTGCFGADPLRAFARGFPLDWNRTAELFAFDELRVLRLSTAPYSDAGADLDHQLAFLFATLLDTLRNLEPRGIDPATAARRTSLQLELDCDQFLGIAALRATRALWARIAEVIGFDAPACLHAETARRVLTERDPWVNLLRGTVTAFAAIAGGADWITVTPFDAIVGLPGPLGRRLARNTTLLLEEESHLAHVVDPAGGSWYVERLTRELTERSWRTLQEIEAAGGMQAVLTSGWIDRRVEASRAARLDAVAHRTAPITGVSEFADLDEKPLPSPAYRPPARREVPPIADLAAAVEAARQGASLTELALALPTSGPRRPALPVIRFAAGFEALRGAADAHRERTGSRPKIFLANLGSVSEHTARATWARSFFEAGGVAAVSSDGDDPVGAFERSGARAAVICSSDRVYEARAAEVARALSAAGASPLYLAGKPNDAYPVDAFIHIGVDVLATLGDLHRALGVRP